MIVYKVATRTEDSKLFESAIVYWNSFLATQYQIGVETVAKPELSRISYGLFVFDTLEHAREFYNPHGGQAILRCRTNKKWQLRLPLYDSSSMKPAGLVKYALVIRSMRKRRHRLGGYGWPLGTLVFSRITPFEEVK